PPLVVKEAPVAEKQAPKGPVPEPSAQGFRDISVPAIMMSTPEKGGLPKVAFVIGALVIGVFAIAFFIFRGQSEPNAGKTPPPAKQQQQQQQPAPQQNTATPTPAPPANTNATP